MFSASWHSRGDARPQEGTPEGCRGCACSYLRWWLLWLEALLGVCSAKVALPRGLQRKRLQPAEAAAGVMSVAAWVCSETMAFFEGLRQGPEP